MSSIYKQNDQYYIAVTYQSSRIRRALGTSDLKTARIIAKNLEAKLLLHLITGESDKPLKPLSLRALIKKFLSYDHGWSKNTKRINRDSLRKYLNEGFPLNKSYRAMVVRSLNRCYNWGYEQGLVEKVIHYKGGNDYEARTRVFNTEELQKILNDIIPSKFQQFVRFAYYTGARQGEIRRISKDNINQGFVIGKTGRRQIKITRQAERVLLDTDEIWNYSRSYVCSKFKENMNCLNIPDARFHDLRRTFGYNLIKSGLAIYQVSKLLGHKSVTTTEKHYAPLLATDIEDFKL